jgi:hypothetical protein
MNDPNVTNTGADQQSVGDASTESKPLHEKLMPQTSIRSLLALIASSALVMVVFRAATDGSPAARIATLLITTVGGCFVVYACLFLIANIFSSTTAPIVQALESTSAPASTSASGQPISDSPVDSTTTDQETT